jgi:hypothetical protein
MIYVFPLKINKNVFHLTESTTRLIYLRVSDTQNTHLDPPHVHTPHDQIHSGRESLTGVSKDQNVVCQGNLP